MSTYPPPGSGPNQGPNQGASPGPNQGPNQSQGPGPGGVGRRLEEAVELIEMELRHAIAYVNDAVIPQVRRESVSAMRTVSDTLRDLADRIDRRHQPPKGPQP
jgi:hypothetical protein